jgi:hypothetical protein
MRTKKIILLSFLTFAGFQLHSQVTSIATSYDYMSSYLSEKANGNEQSAIENLLAAKKEIDPVTSDPSTRGMSKAWKRKGEIYYYIFADQSPRLTLVKEGAVDTAIRCFTMAVTVEKKENGQPKIEDKSGVINFLGLIGDTLVKVANIGYENKEMNVYFDNMVKAKKAFDARIIADPKDDASVKAVAVIAENLAVTAANSGKEDLIMAYVAPMVDKGDAPAWAYQVMAQVYLGKGDKTKAGEIIKKGKEKHPEDAEIYIAEINLAFENGETDNAGTLIETAKTKFPDKKANFILLEVNFHLTKGNNEAAIKALDEAIATHKDKKDILKLLYFNSGVIFSQMFTKAEEAEPQDTAKMREYNNKMFEYYSKTVEVDPTYDPAYNGLGNYYITNGNMLLKQADALPLEKDKEYKALKALALEEYKKGIDALEKAWAVKKEPAYKRVLIQLYEKTGQFDKKKAIEAQ